MKGKTATAVMAVIFSSLMFGALGLCARYFRDCGLSSNDVVVIRLTISALGLVVLSIILVNVKLRLEYLKRYGKYISPLFKLKTYSSRYDTIYVIPPRYGLEIKGVPRILIRKAVLRK